MKISKFVGYEFENNKTTIYIYNKNLMDRTQFWNMIAPVTTKKKKLMNIFIIVVFIPDNYHFNNINI